MKWNNAYSKKLPKANNIFLLVISALLLAAPHLSAQKKGYSFDRKKRDFGSAYPSPDEFRSLGLLVDAGITNTFGWETTSNDFGAYQPLYRPAVLASIGGYYSLPKLYKIIRYIDLTVGYKSIWAASKFEAYPTFGPQPMPPSRTNNAFENYVSANFNLNNTITVSRYHFIQNSIGVNADYVFFSEYEPQANNPGSLYPGPFILQLHYKIGWGIQLDTDRLLIIWGEVPVFNLSPSQTNFNQLDFYNNSFLTVSVGVRFMFFRLADIKCPKVRSYDKPPNFQNGY